MGIVFGLSSKLTLAQACYIHILTLNLHNCSWGYYFPTTRPFTDGDTEAQKDLQHGQGGTWQIQDVNPGHRASEFTLLATLLLGHTTSERVQSSQYKGFLLNGA